MVSKWDKLISKTLERPNMEQLSMTDTVFTCQDPMMISKVVQLGSLTSVVPTCVDSPPRDSNAEALTASTLYQWVGLLTLDPISLCDQLLITITQSLKYHKYYVT